MFIVCVDVYCLFCVLLPFSDFNGFQSSNTTTDVTVRLGEAVALKCDILGAAPSPDYIWLNDNTTIDTSTNTDKIRTLDDGATLVIYNLQTSDTAPLYSCGVTNARMYDTEVSTRLYRLIVTGKIGILTCVSIYYIMNSIEVCTILCFIDRV